jgi:trehalose/maltose hydrolase-like predicted phosphorylase
VIFGFAGMMPATASDELAFSPHSPKTWKRLAFNVRWHGKRHFVTITQEGMEIVPK